MKTLKDIKYEAIYSLARVWCFILYDMIGVHIAIPVPNAARMSLIRPFTNAIECKNHIDTNNQKEITLFICDNNMPLLITNSYFDNTTQLKKINIFCSSDQEKDYWTRWRNRYRDRVEEPFLYDELDSKLLLYGLGHIETVRQQFRDNNTMLTKLEAEKDMIWNSLVDHFTARINDENRRIQLSEEAEC